MVELVVSWAKDGETRISLQCDDRIPGEEIEPWIRVFHEVTSELDRQVAVLSVANQTPVILNEDAHGTAH